MRLAIVCVLVVLIALLLALIAILFMRLRATRRRRRTVEERTRQLQEEGGGLRKGGPKEKVARGDNKTAKTALNSTKSPGGLGASKKAPGAVPGGSKKSIMGALGGAAPALDAAPTPGGSKKSAMRPPLDAPPPATALP